VIKIISIFPRHPINRTAVLSKTLRVSLNKPLNLFNGEEYKISSLPNFACGALFMETLLPLYNSHDFAFPNRVWERDYNPIVLEYSWITGGEKMILSIYYYM